MFSNGMEYRNFTGAFCERCSKFVDTVEEKEACPVEWKISQTSITGNKEDFPYEHLKETGNNCVYACKEFQSNDEKLMNQYKNMMEDLDES